MRKFIHQDQIRSACQGRIEIKFLKLMSFVVNQAQRDQIQPLEQRRRLRTAVRFHHSDGQVDALANQHAGGAEHCISLADPRAGAEKYLQFPAPGLKGIGLKLGEKRVRIGALNHFSHARPF